MKRAFTRWTNGLSAALMLMSSSVSGDVVYFDSGDVDDLRAISPDLEFDELVIEGTLELRPEDEEVLIAARELRIEDGGRIVVDQFSTEYEDSPDLFLFTSERLVIDGTINLTGKAGDREMIGGTQFHRCHGSDAGDLWLRSEVIEISAWVGLRGGPGSWEELHQGGERFIFGCSGGDGGVARIEALERIDVLVNGEISTSGGTGGWGGLNGEPGSDGEPGRMLWLASKIEVEENESNGAMHRAQGIPTSPHRLMGSISRYDDADTESAEWIPFEDGSSDRAEDIFVLPGVGRAKLRLEPEAATSDIDLYVFDSELDTVSQSAQEAGHSEEVIFHGDGSPHYVVVNLCVDANGCDPAGVVTTDWTLTVGPDLAGTPADPAQLEERDLLLDGDRLVTFDPGSGLEWLDPGYTANLSVEDVQQGALGLVEESFRYASRDEICSLFARYSRASCRALSGLSSGTESAWALFQRLHPTTQQLDSGAIHGFFDGGSMASGRVGEAVFEWNWSGSPTVGLIVANSAAQTTKRELEKGHFLVRRASAPSVIDPVPDVPVSHGNDEDVSDVPESGGDDETDWDLGESESHHDNSHDEEEYLIGRIAFPWSKLGVLAKNCHPILVFCNQTSQISNKPLQVINIEIPGQDHSRNESSGQDSNNQSAQQNQNTGSDPSNASSSQTGGGTNSTPTHLWPPPGQIAIVTLPDPGIMIPAPGDWVQPRPVNPIQRPVVINPVTPPVIRPTVSTRPLYQVTSLLSTLAQFAQGSAVASVPPEVAPIETMPPSLRPCPALPWGCSGLPR